MRFSAFAVCLDESGLDDLVQLKVYPVLPDAIGEEHDMLRVVDESGEDYLYPAERFLVLALSQDAVARIETAAAAS